MTHDIVIRDAYLQERDEVLDVAVDDGRIARIAESIDAAGDREIDADGNLVSPGFVDCHKHIDRAFAAEGGRKPHGVDGPFVDRDMGGLFDEHFENASIEEIAENAIRDVQMAVENGTTHVRSHVGVDHTVGTDTMEACLRAHDQLDDIVDLQLVPAAFGGIRNGDGEARVREAIEMGLDAVDDDSAILVGGADPGTRNQDVTGTVETWFDVATDYGVDVDVHIQNVGSLGHHTLERLVAETGAHDYEGRVTASHCFSLARTPDWRLDQLIEEFTGVDLKAVTCYNSIRWDMPVRELVESGVPLGHGTDNDRDFVIPHGNADSLEAAQVLSLELLGHERQSESYRWSETNPGIDVLWDLLTHQGAKVFDIEDEYGIEEGAAADVVVLDEPSRQWATIKRAEKSCVLKNGEIVAEDGELLPEYRVV